ncbi:MAG: GDYXXLXY domain-containing protein [Planctomycetia bacterium]|nr:GDYXXLXY domain-containing protein [Planctomycetia bacterium]
MSTEMEEATSHGGIWTWIQRRERVLLVLAVAFQLGVLGAMIALSGWTLMTGDTVLFRVIPVDPRDMFRGDYVILRYEFSNISPNGHDLYDSTQSGREIYVTLVADSDGRHWGATSATFERPASGRFMKGKVVGPGNIEFGIESFFVQEGKGKEYEEARTAHRLSAVVALTDQGAASLKELVLE